MGIQVLGFWFKLPYHGHSVNNEVSSIVICQSSSLTATPLESMIELGSSVLPGFVVVRTHYMWKLSRAQVLGGGFRVWFR